jgi:hypothetical protein
MNKIELSKRLIQEHQSFIDFISSLSNEDLIQSQDNKWNPSQQLEHVYLCLRPVKLALSLPNIIPAILFGKSKKGSRTYESLVEAYQLKLKNGGKSPSMYKPKKSVRDVDKLKIALMHLVNDISNKLSQFQENDLDGFLLPHPLLGKLTARELIFFALYHVGHHQKQIEK